MSKKSQTKYGAAVLGMIPARYASSRFPGKILAAISGKTLIQRTYENASRCSSIGQLVVATDDQRIYDHIQGFGGSVVMTSISCATGTDRIVEALHHYPQFKEIEIVVNIQGDEPCLDPTVIDQVIEKLKNDPDAVMATAVTPLTSFVEANSSSVVKCVFDRNDNALYFSRSLIPGSHPDRKGQAYYKHIGIYAYRRSFLERYATLPQTPLQMAEDLEQLKVLEHGYRIKVAVVNSHSIGVDEPQDIQKVEAWLCKQNLSS